MRVPRVALVGRASEANYIKRVKQRKDLDNSGQNTESPRARQSVLTSRSTSRGVNWNVAIAAGHGDTQTGGRVSSGSQAHQRRDAVRQEEAGAKVVERLSIALSTGVVYIHSGCSGP
jgi:hypothetical protein